MPYPRWWKWRHRLPVAPHPYTSTACQHGIHDQCRHTCKFCSEPCRCTCHEGWDD